MEELSTSWHSYPKIYHIGHAAIKELFSDPVIVEEKVDGSQFSFGRFGGELRVRSKRVQLVPDAPEKMFEEAVAVARELDLTDGLTYRAEYLKKPKHNALAYSRIPEKHLMILDINSGHEEYLPYEAKQIEAKRIGLEVVPCLYKGKISSSDEILSFLKLDSVLGGVKPEGVVIKNYKRFCPDGKVCMGKFVSEEFKEVHKSSWNETNKTSKDILQLLGEQYKHSARWMKAVQRLRDEGQLTESPKDIGKLIKEVQRDIDEECADPIAQKLLKWGMPSIKRVAVRGLPEWYKEWLMKKAFEEDE